MAAKDPAERRLISSLAAHEKWSLVEDRQAATAAARQAFDDHFEKQVDPDGKLDPAERARRAQNAKRAHFSRMALRSAQARRARKVAGPESRAS